MVAQATFLIFISKMTAIRKRLHDIKEGNSLKDTQPFMKGNSVWYTIASKMPHDILFLKKGVIYHPDEFEDKVAILVEGLLKVFLSESTGEERFMWIVEPYSIIQWRINHNFSHNLIAIKNSKLYLINQLHFFNTIREDTDLFNLYIDSIYQKYTYSVEKLIVSDTHNSQFKLYSFLLHLAYRYGKPQIDGSIWVENILTRNDISSITGVHRTNIIKYLSRLESLDIINKGRNYISIKNLSALKNLIDSLDSL